MLTLLEITSWLRQQDEAKLTQLWQQANQCRAENVGDAVQLRGLVEFSNYCRRRCGYCGLHAGRSDVQRYRMSAAEIVDCALDAVRFGYGTVVLQSGEDPGLQSQWLAEVISEIKRRTALAVTLSVGERSVEDFQLWRDAGADRYLLRFETSNAELYQRIHPSLPGQVSDRFSILRQLRQLGYEIGSGVMVGIPGQDYTTLANDIVKFAELDLDMIGVGPYIAHPQTDLATAEQAADQVPNSELMTYKVVALARLICPYSNIPSTTALATLNKARGRELGLERGANVVMPNLTPVQYRAAYEIYPAKACINETSDACHQCMRGRITAIGRSVGDGRGDSPRHQQRNQEQEKGA